ncbi:MAG: AraC family transcriptional regulator [Angelakisella sp.]
MSSFLEQLSFQVNSVGVWRSTHKKLANYTINDVEFIFYVQGGSKTTIVGAEYECQQNDFMVLEPMQLYSSENDGIVETEYYFIHFDVEPVLYLKPFIECFRTPITRIENPQRVINIFKMIQQEVRCREQGYISTINALIKLLSIEVLRSQQHGTSTALVGRSAKSAAELFVDQCIAHISRNLKGDCSVESLSSHFNLSKNYIYKAFMQVLHEPPSKYVTRMRMLRAKSLLLTDLFTIEEVAEEVGYATLAHFSKVFKQYTQYSPREYKKRTLSQ